MNQKREGRWCLVLIASMFWSLWHVTRLVYAGGAKWLPTRCIASVHAAWPAGFWPPDALKKARTVSSYGRVCILLCTANGCRRCAVTARRSQGRTLLKLCLQHRLRGISQTPLPAARLRHCGRERVDGQATVRPARRSISAVFESEVIELSLSITHRCNARPAPPCQRDFLRRAAQLRTRARDERPSPTHAGILRRVCEQHWPGCDHVQHPLIRLCPVRDAVRSSAQAVGACGGPPWALGQARKLNAGAETHRQPPRSDLPRRLQDSRDIHRLLLGLVQAGTVN